MSQSIVINYIHITFSTKNRKPLIKPIYAEDLYSYLGGICRSMECIPVKIGGFNDHIHILCGLSKKIPLVKLMGDLKSHSSKWMKTKDDSLSNFFWQDGYGAFSVNPGEIEVVISYIANQHEHHRKKTFQDEYRAFLKKYNMEFDERYVWD